MQAVHRNVKKSQRLLFIIWWNCWNKKGRSRTASIKNQTHIKIPLLPQTNWGGVQTLKKSSKVLTNEALKEMNAEKINISSQTVISSLMTCEINNNNLFTKGVFLQGFSFVVVVVSSELLLRYRGVIWGKHRGSGNRAKGFDVAWLWNQKRFHHNSDNRKIRGANGAERKVEKSENDLVSISLFSPPSRLRFIVGQNLKELKLYEFIKRKRILEARSSPRWCIVAPGRWRSP